jgi:serine/threonine-protein kinase RsbT
MKTWFQVQSQAQVEQFRRTARRLALDIGMSPESADELALLSSELGTNLTRYATGGQLQCRRIDEGRSGIEVESRDDGPGIADVSAAMTDGSSSTGHLGGGLPAVRRLADDFEIRSSSAGTFITALKWLR